MPPDMNLESTAAKGNRAAILRALRNRLAKEIERSTSSRDIAALSRQLTLILAEIEGLPVVKKRTPLDELASRRVARIAKRPPSRGSLKTNHHP